MRLVEMRLTEARFFTGARDHTFTFEFVVDGQRTIGQLAVVAAQSDRGMDGNIVRAHENLAAILERALAWAKEHCAGVSPDARAP